MFDIASDFQKARSANSTDSSYLSRIPTTTEPTQDGVLVPGRLAGKSFETLLVLPYGQGSDDTTINLRIVGWSKINTLWVPTLLAELAGTLSQVTGVSGASVLDTERFADILSLTNGIAVLVNPTSDSFPAYASVGVEGFQKVEFLFKLGTATQANALVKVG
jgi:hypothetical protein